MAPTEEIKVLQERITELEQKLHAYQGNGPEAFFNEMNRWVNNSTEFIKLKSDKIDELVGGDNKEFERIMVLIKNTKENVETLASLRTTLGLAKKETADKPKELITPESMADVLGDNKRQQV